MMYGCDRHKISNYSYRWMIDYTWKWLHARSWHTHRHTTYRQVGRYLENRASCFPWWTSRLAASKTQVSRIGSPVRARRWLRDPGLGKREKTRVWGADKSPRRTSDTRRPVSWLFMSPWCTFPLTDDRNRSHNIKALATPTKTGKFTSYSLGHTWMVHSDMCVVLLLIQFPSE